MAERGSMGRAALAEYGRIFVSFFKIGLFTFGGGYAMLPLFRQELIEKRGYISENELLDYYSIGQCTPGVIAVNVATFTGYKISGVSGACIATLAINLPSLVIIMVLAGILNTLSANPWVAHAFAGIRIGVIALILNEVILLLKKTVGTKFQRGMFIFILILLFAVHLSAVAVVLFAALTGGIKYWKERAR